MKVLMATDGSEQSTTALRTAIRILKRDGIKPDVLCVAPELRLERKKSAAKESELKKLADEYKEKIGSETEKILKQAKKILADEGVEAGAKNLIGSPASVIIRESVDYDLSVVGAHDRYHRTKPGLGHVAARVVAQGAGAVLVARDFPYEKSLRVLVGVDGSLSSIQAINFLAGYFRVESAEITLMHVVETPWIRFGLERDWFDYPGRLFSMSEPGSQINKGIRFASEEVIDSARAELEGYGLGSEVIVVEGDPALEMLSEAEKGEYDLIVIGATGHTDLKHNMLGSVSTKIAQDASCSVLIVKSME